MSKPRPIAPSIDPLDESALGPAMLECSPAERIFVMGKVAHGLNNTDAAIAAGYSETSAGNLGYLVAHREHVQKAIVEASWKYLRDLIPAALRAARDILAMPNHKDHGKIVLEILSRGGLNAVSQSHVTVEHKLDVEQLDARILQVAQELGLGETEARKLLVDPSNIVEGEFKQLLAPPTPEEMAEQARRDRANERKRALAAMTPEERAEAKLQKQAERAARAKAAYEAARLQREIDEWIVPASNAPEQNLMWGNEKEPPT